MAYTTINKPSEYFNTKLYTGNGSTQSITGVGFQPDWVWIKSRSSAYHHQVYDVIRGSTKKLLTSDTISESTDANGLTSFDSDGFSLGTNVGVNENTSNHVAWNWLAGGTGVSNTDGSITSTVSASTTSGFSIVSYTGTGSNATVGHGLGVAPAMVIVKERSGVDAWIVGHSSIGFTKNLLLNANNAEFADSTIWNNTAPTSSVFSVGSSASTNESSATYIAYCFAEKKGFSRFGSYLGTGSAAYGAFNYCGFTPAFVMVKLSTGVDSWFISDTARATYNPSQQYMRPNEVSAEGTSSAHKIDLLSNGFKIRSADTAYNTLNSTYIYMAFAKHPLVSSTGTPCTAR